MVVFLLRPVVGLTVVVVVVVTGDLLALKVMVVSMFVAMDILLNSSIVSIMDMLNSKKDDCSVTHSKYSELPSATMGESVAGEDVCFNVVGLRPALARLVVSRRNERPSSSLDDSSFDATAIVAVVVVVVVGSCADI